MGGFRGDAERWPGGGCEGYMRRLVQELMPLVSDTFATATDPARVAFGGGSFAGGWVVRSLLLRANAERRWLFQGLQAVMSI